MIPQPPKTQLRRGEPAFTLLQELFRLLRQVHQFSAPQGLHDDHRDPFRGSSKQSFSPGLGMLIQVIVLDLTEIPVVELQDIQEGLRISVVRKADLTDLPRLFLLPDPFFDIQFLKLSPFQWVCEHMHQVVVDVVGPQPFQFLPEDLFDPLFRPDQVLGQLGGDLHLFPAVVLPQDPPQGLLTAGVHIGGIVVIHALLHRQHDLFLRFFEVDAAALSGKAHAPVAQLRNGLSVLIVPILHFTPPDRSFGTPLQGSSRPSPYPEAWRYGPASRPPKPPVHLP